MKNGTTWNCAFPAISFALILVACGCRTAEPYSGSFASVTIKGRTQEQIRQTTTAVFRENGYSVVFTGYDEMRFEKEGTRGQTLLHGSLMSVHEGRGVVVRVKANIIHLESGANRLQCNAFMVTDPGDSFFENESRVHLKRKPYQNLLNQVAERLK